MGREQHGLILPSLLKENAYFVLQTREMHDERQTLGPKSYRNLVANTGFKSYVFVISSYVTNYTNVEA